jgi:hypothetical protein
MDALDEKAAFVGRIFWQGFAASKTVSSAGGKIHFRTGATTFANAGTTVRVGLQDLDATAGPPPNPDGTFDVFDDITGGDPELTSSSDNVFVTATMSSGTKTLSNGDLVAVVWDMTARGGTDSLILTELSGGGQQFSPTVVANLTGSWTLATPGRGCVVIEADDGTLGTLMGTVPIQTVNTRTFSDATNPDEEGLILRVPVDCKIGGYVLMMQANAAGADYEINLYSDPTGTPAAVSGASLTGQLGEHGGGAQRTLAHFMLPAEVTLTAGTDYCLAVKATGASGLVTVYHTLRSADDRPILGLTDCSRTTRNGASGAFAAGTTDEIPHFGVLISSLHDGSGGGGGGLGMLWRAQGVNT